MVPAPQRATGSSATIANSAAPTVVALSSLAQRCGAAARKDQRNLAALIMMAALTRAREAAPIPARSDADRPAPAGSALRLLADVDNSFSRNWCWQILALDAGARAGRPAPMLTAASPGRGGGDGAGAAASYRVIGNDRKFRSTDRGGDLISRSPLLTSGSDRSAEFGCVDHAGCPHARARRRRFQRALTPTDRPARRRCGCWPTSTVLFRGIGVGRFGAGRWRSGDRRRC